jgi:Rrf2 family protein
MQITARSEYALRATAVLAARTPDRVSLGELSDDQHLPRPFLEQIFAELRRARLVQSWRGPHGGYALGRPAAQISLGDVIRAVDGELTEVRGQLPADLAYSGSAAALSQVLQAVDISVRRVLDATTLENLAAGRLPSHVQRLLSASRDDRPTAGRPTGSPQRPARPPSPPAQRQSDR